MRKVELPKQPSCSRRASSRHSLLCRVLTFLIGRSEHTCVLHCQVPPNEWLSLLLYWGLPQRSGLLRSQLAVSEVTPCFHAPRRLCISCHTCLPPNSFSTVTTLFLPGLPPLSCFVVVAKDMGMRGSKEGRNGKHQRSSSPVSWALSFSVLESTVCFCKMIQFHRVHAGFVWSE